MAATKAFRAVLPRGLRQDQVEHVERWARNNCAMYCLLDGDSGRKVLIGLQSRPRIAASYARTLRTALNRMAIETSGLHGHWLRVISVQEALLATCGALGVQTPGAHAQQEGGSQETNDDVETCVVRLY